MYFFITGLDCKCHATGKRIFLILEYQMSAPTRQPCKYFTEIGVNSMKSSGKRFVLHLLKFLYPLNKSRPFVGQGIFSLGSFPHLPLDFLVLLNCKHIHCPDLTERPVSLCYLAFNF